MALENGTAVRIRELSIAELWPYINGEPVDPEVLIRLSVVDADGAPAIADDEGVPMAQALELIPHIMTLNRLETGKADAAAEVAELERDFPRPASAG